jgi:hypothetical protein
LLEVKSSFETGLDGIYLPMQLTDWPLVEVALLLIGDPLGRDQSSFRLPALDNFGLNVWFGLEHHEVQ